MSAATAAEVEARIEALARTLEHTTQQLANARGDLARSERRWRRQTEGAVAAAAAAAAQGLGRERKSIEANAAQARAAALSIVGSALRERAPGYLSADWTDAIWSTLRVARHGEWLRVGSLAVGPDTLPVALPLSAGVWQVVGPTAGAFTAFVQNTIARVVAAFDPPRVRVVAYDPDLTVGLAAFAGLRAVSQHSVPPAITADEDVEHALEALLTEVAAVDDRLTAAGQSGYWSALAAAHPLAATTPLRLLVVGSPATRLSDRGRARLDQLRRLAPERGLLVIESVDAASRPAAAATAVTVTLATDAATAGVLPGVSWRADAWAGDRFIRALCAGLVDRPRQSLAPSVDFQKIVDGIDDPWMDAADDGIEAVIGVVDGGDLTVRLRAEEPPMPNALVGGAVGQGKSNLLLVLIHSLAARYSPAELEMVLVDLRDGVEFARLGPTGASPTWLPHVRALGLEFDPDYSLAVLRWVKDQLPIRSRLLQEHGATKLKEYRRRSGKTMPRLLVVIDEFQRLFEGDDDQAAEAAALLENIARTGRGFGVHVVLASQAITGIRGLAAKADAIFGQFHNRVALRNTPAESQAFLTAHNLAAAELEHRGQAVVNDALGAIDGNKLGTIAYAQPDYLEQLQVQLHRQGHGAAPSMFRASAFASWPERAPRRAAPNAIAAAVGMPIAVEAEPRTVTLTRSPNQAIAVVGSTRDVAVAILVRTVVTVAESIGPGAKICILDGDGHGEAPAAWVGALADALGRRGCAVVRVAGDGVAAKLMDLGKGTASADLVVAIALDSVDLGTPTEPDYEIPGEALQALVKSGPLHGTWTVGWWQSKSVLEEQLGYRATGVRAWAFAGVSRDDLADVAGHAVRAPSASPRFVWFDRSAGAGAERLVPFAPTDVLGAVELV